jgi:hypothetical protein
MSDQGQFILNLVRNANRPPAGGIKFLPVVPANNHLGWSRPLLRLPDHHSGAIEAEQIQLKAARASLRRGGWRPVVLPLQQAHAPPRLHWTPGHTPPSPPPHSPGEWLFGLSMCRHSSHVTECGSVYAGRDLHIN